jgi:hypothetical protein
MSETLTRVGDRLAALIEEETAQLRGRSPGAIAALQTEKADLARIWAEGVAQVKQRKLAPGPHAPALAKAAARLEAALVQNEIVLKAATIATDRVVAAIADAVREQRSCGVGYGMRRQAPRTRAPASGIAVDRKL